MGEEKGIALLWVDGRWLYSVLAVEISEVKMHPSKYCFLESHSLAMDRDTWRVSCVFFFLKRKKESGYVW